MIDTLPSLTAAAIVWPAAIGLPRMDALESSLAAVRSEFPTVDIVQPNATADTRAVFDEAWWSDPANDLVSFDRTVDGLASRGKLAVVLCAASEHAPDRLAEMLTRWQRLVVRRNPESRTPAFDRLLSLLRQAHDLEKPLVRADWNHAVDVWQWVLRLDPSSSAAVQMAALLHDVERLESEADGRVEHLAPSYAEFKQRHAARGAEIAAALLGLAGADRASADRAARLVANHEVPGNGPELALLNDADALSFFSQNSAGYLDYFGAEQGRRKIAYSLARMRPRALRRLAGVRMRRDVAAIARELGLASEGTA
jgi:hypothetical protein